MAKVGQFFALGAVILGALIIGVLVTATSSTPKTAETATSNYFDSASDSIPEAVDTALSRKKSVEKVKRHLYRHLRLVEIAANRRGLNFESKLLVVFPRPGEVLYINYAAEQSRVNISVDGNSSQSQVKPYQFYRRNFSSGPASFSIEFLEEENLDTYSFNASGVRTFHYVEMADEEELYRDSSMN